MKKTIVIAIIFVCIGATYLYPHAMISPGELIAGHQELNNKCQSCHTLFSGISNNKCISCHKVSDIGKDSVRKDKMQPGRFKIPFHQSLSNQECASCHNDHKGLNPDTLIRGFKHDLLSIAILNKCINCHVKPADSYHQLITANCNKCHSSIKWVPSTFNHSGYFQLDKNHNVSCNTCHVKNNFSTYTCYGCHEHNENEIISKHNEEGLYNISNCVSCHKSGNEHDIRMNGIDNLNRNSDTREQNNIKEYKNREQEDD